MTSVNKNTRINAHFFAGSRCFERSHHLEAIKHFEVGVSERSACCKAGLSYYYGHGLCIRKDTLLARRLYYEANTEGALSLLKSCGNTNVQALLWRGLLVYWIGNDLAEARRLLESSSELGNAYATYFLVTVYFDMKGVDIDNEIAFKLHEKAAEQSNECSDAFYYMASICKQKISDDAVCHLAELFGFEHLGVRPVDFDEEKVEKDMVNYYVKAAENGHARAAFELASYYKVTICDAKSNKAKALKYYRKSADAGYYLAFFELGNYYEKGTPEQNLERACKYYDLGTKLCHIIDVEDDRYRGVMQRLINSKDDAEKYCVDLLESGTFFTRMPRFCLAKIIKFALEPIKLCYYGNITTLTVEQITSVICKVSH